MAFWLTVFAPFQYRAGMQNSMIGVILALSLVVVTGYVLGRNRYRMDLCRQLGATAVIDPGSPDWLDQLHAVTGSQGCEPECPRPTGTASPSWGAR